MTKICPLSSAKVTYLVCQECDQKTSCNELILKRAEEKIKKIKESTK